MGLGYVAVKIKKKSPLHKSFDFAQKMFGKKSNDDENHVFRLINPCLCSCFPQSACLL